MTKDQYASRTALAISLVAAALPSLAWGQAADAEPEADAAPMYTSEDIVVTAQRRSERLQDVPAIVAVISGDDLRTQGVSGTADLATSIPGVTFTNFGVFPSPSIRGVASQSVSTGAENAVAVFLDGLYIPNQVGGLFDLPDVSRVEVLKGPQGTLYGRNATAGAILITTETPSTVDPHVRARVSYGRFNDLDISGVVSVPIIQDKLALLVSGGYHRRDGFVRDIVNNRDLGRLETSTIRAKLLFTPTPDITLTLNGYISKRYDESTFAATVYQGNTGAKRTDPAVVVTTEPFTTAQDHTSFVEGDVKAVSGKLEFNLPFGSLTSLTGYQVNDAFISADSDQTVVPVQAIDITMSSRVWSHDVYFVSRRFGPAEFTVGYSYYNAKNASLPLAVLVSNSLVRTIYGIVGRDTHAAYGEATVHLTNELSASFGVRYTHEGTTLDGSFSAGTLPRLGTSSFKNTSFSGVLKYQMPDIGNLYASFRQGFKTGDYSVSTLNPNPTRPERINAYELGFKSERLGNVTFSVAGFYYNYTDLIATVSTPNGTLYTNAPKARIYGADFETTWRATSNLSFAASATYSNAKYTSYPGAIANVPVSAATCTAAGTTYPCGNASAVLDLTGMPLMRAPKFTATLQGTYRADVGEGDVELFGKFYYNSGFFWEVGDRVEQEAYATFDARLTWHPRRDGPLAVSVWGKNLTDAVYGVSGNVTSTADSIAYALPRSFGATLEVSF